MKVDFALVMKNAASEGIDLQQIAIQYEDLAPEELTLLAGYQEVTHHLRPGSVLAKFPLTGMPLLPHKATAVLYLAA